MTPCAVRPPSRAAIVGLVAIVGLAASPGAGSAQQGPSLRVVGPAGEAQTVPVSLHRGYAALPVATLEAMGWSAERRHDVWELTHPTGVRLRLREGSPFFHWDDGLLQMTDEPYALGGRLHAPLQLLTDFLPARFPQAYRLEDGPTLRVHDERHWVGVRGESTEAGAAGTRPPASSGGTQGVATEGPRVRTRSAKLSPDGLKRVVVIDPGHGGTDPGATGPGGTREKDVALRTALALKRELDRYPGLEVHLTRDSDLLVPLWKRGEIATRAKGDRPGIFISIHANALPDRRATRGFETYFLSEARTEHERRVAANENAPLAVENGGAEETVHPELSFILKELRNFDHQHWSALLAGLIQGRVAPVHPGPDRGVKQGPFAVITNALMPAVLVETGFISNREEERVLARADFQEDLARALARAVLDFFERYPPELGTHLEGAGAGAR